LSSEELGNRLQTPTLIGCIFLMIYTSNSIQHIAASRLAFSALAVISWVLDCSMVLFPCQPKGFLLIYKPLGLPCLAEPRIIYRIFTFSQQFENCFPCRLHPSALQQTAMFPQQSR
ncbi:MAG: hypothetical protein Q7K57_50900, partial [Burkholderiaceae bacterium]|nr:hypothetical protein [Burkholderiaceae bacterium]